MGNGHLTGKAQICLFGGWKIWNKYSRNGGGLVVKNGDLPW